MLSLNKGTWSDKVPWAFRTMSTKHNDGPFAICSAVSLSDDVPGVCIFSHSRRSWRMNLLPRSWRMLRPEHEATKEVIPERNNHKIMTSAGVK